MSYSTMLGGFLSQCPFAYHMKANRLPTQLHSSDGISKAVRDIITLPLRQLKLIRDLHIVDLDGIGRTPRCV